MNRFRSIMLPMQGHNKSNLHMLYNTITFYEKEKIFTYYNLKFWFGGSNHRNSEKLILFVEMSKALFDFDYKDEDMLPLEDYLLRLFSPKIFKLSKNYINTNKNVREKAQFFAQSVNENIIKRNGMLYKKENDSFILRISFNVPLINAISVNAKSAVRAVREILETIEESITNFNKEDFQNFINTYTKQQQIRRYLTENNLVAFIADGSILPRKNGTATPLEHAIPFISPDELRITIPFDDDTKLSGMGIKKGITVITGGGYSGKSTLLDAIEMGIYDHIPGDGREFVITDNTALKTYAEDGRPVHNMDISPFFKYIPGGNDIKTFSTSHASGSVSQATNIIEAICGGCKLLLIDEDKSATNFMIRDVNMRQIVKNEPIIPFTDRIRELYSEMGISTILVIGGSSEYIGYADNIILMDAYIAKDITDIKYKLNLTSAYKAESNADWMTERYLIPKESNQPFLYFSSVSSENAKKIILDEYSADITLLTALVSENQLNTLAYMMEQLLTDKESDRAELNIIATEISNKMYSSDIGDVMISFNFKIDCWFEAVRPIDIFCCANRMRGLQFK